MPKRALSTRQLALCALFAALVAIGSQIQIPLPMIPINLALVFVHLSGALLGKKYGALAICAYLLLGLVGVPVFAGFQGGPGVLFGRTGGYIIGYIFSAFIVGLMGEKWGRNYFKLCLSMACGVIVCYTFGTAWFMAITGTGLWVSLSYCVFPFLLGDVIKIIAAAFLTQRLQKPLGRTLS